MAAALALTLVVLGAAGCGGGEPREAAAPPTGAPSSAPAGAEPDGEGGAGARIVRTEVIDERVRDLTIDSPAVGAEVPVRLMLPADWESRPGGPWPVLYLLHGCCDSYQAWTRSTDIEELPELRDVLVVMPDGGKAGLYTDWLGDGPQWETFHTGELLGLLESDYGAGEARAIAGLSMGGLGALGYAARNPGMFRAVGSYSGIVSTLFAGASGTEGPDLIRGLVAFQGEDPLGAWGDPVEQVAVWREHDPVALAERLIGTPVYISAGNGSPGPLDDASARDDPLEASLGRQNAAFADRLTELGVPAEIDLYGPGRHDWPYWERSLERSLPLLLGPLR